MAHQLSLFVASPTVLRGFRRVVPGARAFRLRPGAAFAVLPLTDAVHDTLHAALGTGEWLDAGPRLTTTDMEFAARVAASGGLAYVETDYASDSGEAGNGSGNDGGNDGGQSAILWRGGERILGPVGIRGGEHARPRQFWPINAVLRGLGVLARDGWDEFDTLGLGRFATSEVLIGGAMEIAL